MITLKQNIKIISVVCGLILCAFNHLMAQTWLGTTDSKWETVSNWSTGKLPASSSTVTFDNDGNNRRTLQLGNKTYCKNIKYQTPLCASYQFGNSRTQRLWLINSGTFTIDADVINNQTVYAYLQLGNAAGSHTISIYNNSPVADFTAYDMKFSSSATGAITLALRGVGDMFLNGTCVTNTVSQCYFRILNTGTITCNGYTRINRLYSSNAVGFNTHLVLNAGAEFFLDNANINYSIWHENNGLIEGAGTLRFGVGPNGEPARVYLKTDSELTIKTPITSAGGLEHYNTNSGGGKLILDCVNTISSNLVISSIGMVSVSKIGNRGAIDSNIGKGDKIELTGPGSTLIYTGEGETTDRIIDFSNNVKLDQSGSGELIFSENLIFSSDAKTLTLTGSSESAGELAGTIGSLTNTAALTKDGSGEWCLTSTNSYTGITTVKDGTLTLCGTNGAVASTTSITLSGGTLRIANAAGANVTNRVNDSATITLQGGAIDFAHDGATATDYSETLGALTVVDTAGEIKVAAAAEDCSSSLIFASAEAIGKGTVNFIGDGLGAADHTRCRIFFDTPPVLVNGVIPWALVNGVAMATYDETRGLYASDSIGIAARGPDSVIPDNAALNVQIVSDGVAGAITLENAAGASIATLTQGSATPAVVAMNNQTLQTYRVLVNENAASLTLGDSVAEGGTLHIASGSTDMGFINNSTNALNVNAEIYESVPGTGVLKSGAGQVNLNNKINITGDMLITGGSLTLGALTNGSHYIGSNFELRGGEQTPTEMELNGAAEVINNGSFLVASAAGERCVLNVNSNLSLQATAEKTGGRLYVGTTQDSAGAVIQDSGIMSVSTDLSGAAFYNISGGGGYGYHRHNGGSLLSGEIALGAGGAGTGDGNSGVLDMFGGEINLQGWCLLVGWYKGVYAFNMFDGSLSGDGTLGSQILIMTYGTSSSITAQVNMLGPNARMFETGPYDKKRIEMARGDGNVASVFNLNNGELTLHRAYATSITTPTHFNFNGGLLKAAGNSMMIDGLTAAHVCTGNARIDSNGYDASINQSLVAPQGYGALSVSLLNGGSGYIGAPAVVLEGGSGIGATAIALVDLEQDSPTCGQVTNIMVTGAGSGYAETDTLTAVLRGGGCLTPATAGAATLTPNISGGLIKLGEGSLTLNGACTYTGGTLVNEGTLRIGRPDALPPGSTVTLAAGTVLDLNGFTSTNAVDGSGTFTNGTLYGEFSPAGIGVIGTQNLILGSNAGLAGSYILDVTETGDCDQLGISGSVDLSQLQLQVVDLEKLNRSKNYTIATVTGEAQGVFSPGNLPNDKWLIRSTGNTIILFYSDGLRLLLR